MSKLVRYIEPKDNEMSVKQTEYFTFRSPEDFRKNLNYIKFTSHRITNKESIAITGFVLTRKGSQFIVYKKQLEIGMLDYLDEDEIYKIVKKAELEITEELKSKIQEMIYGEIEIPPELKQINVPIEYI